MTDEEMLVCFTEGFAKTAEAAGFTGDQVRELMELSVGLAQRVVHPADFDAGFNSAIGG